MTGTRIGRVALLLALVVPTLLFGAPIEEGIVDQAKGEASVIGFNGETREARAGDFVLSGEIVQTGSDGYVRLLMEDGSVVVIHENSRVEAMDSRASLTGSQSVMLFLGRLWAKAVESEDDNLSMQVTTPTAVVGIRGTEFDSGVGLDGATRVGVDKGTVEVSSDTGNVVVEAGKETTIELEGAPAAPTDYQSGDEAWREWALERQDRIVKHGDRIVPLMMRDVRSSRRNLARLKAQGDRRFGLLKAQIEKDRAQGKPVELSNFRKRQLARYIKDLGEAVKELYVADRRMLARYYIIQTIYRDTREHPELYSPEFVKTMQEIMSELDEMDIPKIHAENNRILDAYITGMDNFFKKAGIGRYKNGVPNPAERRERLLEMRKAQMEKP